MQKLAVLFALILFLIQVGLTMFGVHQNFWFGVVCWLAIIGSCNYIVWVWERTAGFTFLVKCLSSVAVTTAIVMLIWSPAKTQYRREHPVAAQQQWHISIGYPSIGNFLAGPNGARTGEALLMFFVALKNSGAPNSAEHYRLSIKSDGISISNVVPFVLPKGSHEWNGFAEPSGKQYMNMKEGFLYDKTLRPIQTGETVCGWLAFRVPGVTAEQLRREADWTLSFYDVTDRLQQQTFKKVRWKWSEPPDPNPCAEQVYTP